MINYNLRPQILGNYIVDNNCTIRQVAKVFNMAQQQYSRFENGIFELNYKQIIDICKLLDISPNELFNFD